MDGWIKLHRQIMKSSKFADSDILRLWILCLTKAAHKSTTVLIEKQEIQLLPGQFVTGRYSLHSDYNEALAPRKKVKETTLWSWLKRLEEWGDLDINSTNKYSVISVVKWSEYQETLTAEPQQTDNKLTAEPQQTDTNKNVKKEKNTTTNAQAYETVGDIHTKVFKTFSMTGIMSDYIMGLKKKGYQDSFITELMLETGESGTNPSLRLMQTIGERWMKEGIYTRAESKRRHDESKKKVTVSQPSNPSPKEYVPDPAILEEMRELERLRKAN